MQPTAAHKNTPNAQPLSQEESWTRLLRHMGHWSAIGFGPFLVLDGETEHIVGEAGFAFCEVGIGSSFDTVPEAMWRIDVHSQGKGFATEAMLAAMDWLATHQEFPRTVCMTDPLNLASKRVAEKLEFREFASAVYHGNPVILYERTATTITKCKK